uniref:Inositol polyphosphate phosphatase-like 1b n=1 Tax=Nothobranchius kuhntae TaxID=321403 RepID=A0A1A8JSH2_NOTKU
MHKGATTLRHLKRTLVTACQGLNSEIDLTLASLETLAKVFDHPSCTLTSTKAQGPDMEIDNLLCKISALLSGFDISLRFTHLFWCGDLNYRLDLDVQDILKHVSKREFEELMCADQLTRERHKRKAFFNFNEEKIAFPPTYRYERGSRDCYLWQKYKTSGVRVNVPSWRDPQVIWSGNEALQLPKVSVRHGFNRRSCRRSDFTEIEIPALPPQCAPTSDFQIPQTSSSYQLFPVQSPAPAPPPSGNPIPQYQEQTSPLRDRHQGKTHVLDSVQPESNVRNLYMNHSEMIKETARHDKPLLLPSKTNAVQASKTPSALPYTSSHSAHRHSSASWIVDKRPPAPTGDNSLTALQIAKSLSEVDFFPSVERGQSATRQRMTCRNGPLKQADRGYSWEKEASVLKCAPETVQELLSTLGLQKYTLGLSLSGWDDLDYFSGITEEDLCAAGVTNPSHRRRILENLPRNWT